MAFTGEVPSDTSGNVLPRIDEGVFGGSDGIDGVMDAAALHKLGLEQGPLYRAVIVMAEKGLRAGLSVSEIAIKAVNMALDGLQAQQSRDIQAAELRGLFSPEGQWTELGTVVQQAKIVGSDHLEPPTAA